jgi:hypothetical protein
MELLQITQQIFTKQIDFSDQKIRHALTVTKQILNQNYFNNENGQYEQTSD